LTQYQINQPAGPAAFESTPVLLAYALALELEASERYADLAEQMATHNNPDVAELFEKLSRIEKLHADHVLEQAVSIDLPNIATLAYQWEDPEGPETMDFGDADYLMTAHRALTLALHNEQRAFVFFTKVAEHASDQRVAKLAEEMAAEEEEHVALMEEWLTQYPSSDAALSDDPDPPVDQG
jgi:rubrerythrin